MSYSSQYGPLVSRLRIAFVSGNEASNSTSKHRFQLLIQIQVFKLRFQILIPIQIQIQSFVSELLSKFEFKVSFPNYYLNSYLTLCFQMLFRSLILILIIFTFKINAFLAVLRTWMKGRSSHQSCSIKKLFLKISQYSQ